MIREVFGVWISIGVGLAAFIGAAIWADGRMNPLRKGDGRAPRKEERHP